MTATYTHSLTAALAHAADAPLPRLMAAGAEAATTAAALAYTLALTLRCHADGGLHFATPADAAEFFDRAAVQARLVTELADAATGALSLGLDVATDHAAP